MKTTINSFGFRPSEDACAFVEEKVGKLDKYFSNKATAQAVLRKNKHSYTAEITVFVDGDIYRGEGESEELNLFAAINEAVSCIERQIRKYKSLLKKQKKQNVVLPADEEDENTEFEIARRKTVKLKPMSSDEAILQMHMTNHNWFLFLDADTNCISVVYYRHNGGYGIMRVEE